MPRSLEPWIGKNDDEAVPPHVRLRVLIRFGRRCANCTQTLTGRPWTCDHVIALINGGENRESNLQPLGTKCCNPSKNAADVGVKSKTYQMAAKSAGISLRRGNPMPGTIASKMRRRMNGTVERRS